MTRIGFGLAGIIGLAVASAGGTVALGADALSPAQRAEVEQLVHDYVMKNPEVLMESLHAYDAKQRAEAEKDSAKAVVANTAQLERDPASPVGGNPKGDVTIVEFFDYHCGYCKKVLPAVRELMQTDRDVRVVFKEFPILGAESVAASKIALAVWQVAPEKYTAFHQALMETRGALPESRVLEIAKKLGIDTEKVKAASNSPAVSAAIAANAELAENLRIGGTPAFVVGGKLVPGAVDVDTLRDLVKSTRAG